MIIKDPLWRMCSYSLHMTKCFVCGQLSVCWTGHVENMDWKEVMIGFCNEHDPSKLNNDYSGGCETHETGCYGTLHDETEVQFLDM